MTEWTLVSLAGGIMVGVATTRYRLPWWAMGGLCVCWATLMQGVKIMWA